MQGSVNERISEIFRISGSRNVNQWATRMGIAPTSLGDLLRKKTEPKYGTLLKILQDNPSISAEWLMRGDGPVYLQSEQGNLMDKNVCSEKNALFGTTTTSDGTEILRRLMNQIDGLQSELSALRKQNEMLTNKLLNA